MKNKKTAALYLLAFLIVIYLKHYADRAGSDSQLWILRPTTWWTSLLSGHSFTYEQGTGYINHNLRFIIAPACAGLKFWMITSLMLTCSFLHRIEGPKKQLLWLLICFPAALAATIFTNGIRITLSITLPQILQAQENLPPILTPAQLHTAETAHTAANLPASHLDQLGLHPFGLENLLHLAQGEGGIAFWAGTAVEHKDFHRNCASFWNVVTISISYFPGNGEYLLKKEPS